MARQVIIRVLCDDTLNICKLMDVAYGALEQHGFFHVFSRTRLNFKKSGKLMGCKSSSSLTSCLFEALIVRHLRDQPLTNRHTDKTNKVPTNTL